MIRLARSPNDDRSYKSLLEVLNLWIFVRSMIES